MRVEPQGGVEALRRPVIPAEAEEDDALVAPGVDERRAELEGAVERVQGVLLGPCAVEDDPEVVPGGGAVRVRFRRGLERRPGGLEVPPPQGPGAAIKGADRRATPTRPRGRASSQGSAEPVEH